MMPGIGMGPILAIYFVLGLFVVFIVSSFLGLIHAYKIFRIGRRSRAIVFGSISIFTLICTLICIAFVVMKIFPQKPVRNFEFNFERGFIFTGGDMKFMSTIKDKALIAKAHLINFNDKDSVDAPAITSLLVAMRVLPFSM